MLLKQGIFSQNHLRLTLILTLSSFLSCLLLLARVLYAKNIVYTFLVWNLFLAWVPYAISAWLSDRYIHKLRRAGFIVGLALWLLFIPNAFYIITDFLHLRVWGIVPLWFDVILLLSFAWNGLVLGFISLRMVHSIFERAYGVLIGWATTWVVLFLSSFAIYLGRFLRWNSWDFLTAPQRLFGDIFDRLVNPLLHTRTYAVSFILSLLFGTAYVILVEIGRSRLFCQHETKA